MPQNLFAACRENGELVVKRVRLNNDVQQAVVELFIDQELQFRAGGMSEIKFDGSWKPDEDEVLTLDILADRLGDVQAFVGTIEANAIAIPNLDARNFDQQIIRALFTGTTQDKKTKVLIQQFSPRQMISRKFSLLQDGNTFRKLNDTAFTFDSSLAGIAEDGKLKFKSYHKMRTIVNLSDVYRDATDQEVLNFGNHPTLEVVDCDEFARLADQTIRKLIHALIRSNTLDNYDAATIESGASAVGINVTARNGKIVIPTKLGEIKRFLQFLDDGLYRAQLTGHRYVTNSKRRT